MDWVRERLEVGPGRHGELRGAAEEAGITKGTFYNALDALGVERFEIEGKKWLRLTPTDTRQSFDDTAQSFKTLALLTPWRTCGSERQSFETLARIIRRATP